MSQFRLANFWKYKVTTAEEVWLARFIKHRFQKYPNTLISSVLGRRKDIKPADGEYWIHFCGENNFDRYPEYDDSLVGTCDLSLDFWTESRDGAMRLPLWICYFFSPEANANDIRQVLETSENAKESFLLRELDIAMVAGHKGFSSCPREEFVQKILASDLAFFSEGSYANNSCLLSQSYGDELLDYLQAVKFNFCPENSQALGYTTEKLFSCILQGAIPIYWGSCGLPEFDILNQDRIIKIEEHGIDGTLQMLEALLSKPSKLEEMASQPIFNEQASGVIAGFYDRLALCLRETGKFS